VSLFSVLYFIDMHYSIHFSLVVRIVRPITCDGKSPPQTGAFIEI